MKRINLYFLIIVFLFSFASLALACAPEYDDAYFVRSSKEKFLAIPEGNFLFELKRTGGNKLPFEIKAPQPKRVSDVDEGDLRKSLKASQITEKEFHDAVMSYQKSRDEINSYLQTFLVEDHSLWYGGRFRSHERVKLNLLKNKLSIILTSKVPEEFRLYLTGAGKYHINDFFASINEWSKIFKLPESERKYKSTWASFMIGKAYLSLRDQKRAIPFFEQTRKMAENGYIDSLGLAKESLGWQALAEYEQKDYVSSLKHYLEQMDIDSLNWVCSNVSETTDNTIATIVNDKTARNILLGWAISRPYWEEMELNDDKKHKDFFSRLLSAIEGLKKTDPIDYADRVAWLYYIKGDRALAKRWLTSSKLSTPLARFIDFKLSLRDEKVDEAIGKLSKVISSFEKSPDKNMFFQEDIGRELNSNMAVLKLSRKEYTMAFDFLLKGKYWEDIAYVAEKVLTVQELEDFLNNNKGNSVLANKQKIYEGEFAENIDDGGLTLREALEYLLARRLVRQGELEPAGKYMPTKIKIDRGYIEKKNKSGDSEYEQVNENINPRETLGKLHVLLLNAQNQRIAKKDRAKAYYDAGIIVRRYGMELMGTELDPDGFVDRGAFPNYESIKHRFAHRGFFYGTGDEESRALSSLPSPDKRFHYRYKAADLMWQSAQLLSDNDELKAKALCQGGLFLARCDLMLADKFYKALIRTCGKTELGKQADKLKWFPKIGQ
ncbi:MAG: hypothetical protein HQL26_03675 [Candidatus Omnitrophica bacterium]|nr:hypothetical protein [Candidatus Omnitrophota bacterium]